MELKLLVTYTLCFVVNAVTATNTPPKIEYYRGFSGHFYDATTNRTGQALVTLDTDIISNITVDTEWYYRRIGGVLEIQNGGVGHNFVVFSFFVSAGYGLSFKVKIYTADDEAENESITFEKFDGAEFRSIDFLIMAHAVYRPANKSRTEFFNITFNQDISSCNGESLWVHGNGSSEIRGGISENFLSLELHAPEGVLSSNSYTCFYSTDAETVDRRFSAVGAVEGYEIEDALFQYYDTITPTGNQTFLEIPGYPIVALEGRVEWKNGAGDMYITDGGAGYNSTEWNVVPRDLNSYGTFEYNFTVSYNGIIIDVR